MPLILLERAAIGTPCRQIHIAVGLAARACGVPGRRACGARRRRLSISSRSASSPFRSWSGCSTAPPSNARRGCCAGCGRPSPSAGGSASAISSPGCGGSAARCWSTPTNSPGRCRSPSCCCRRSWRSSMAWPRPLARLFWTDDIGRIASLAAAFALFEWVRTFIFTGFPWNPDRPCRDAGAAADAVGRGRRNVGNECACGAAVFAAGAACRLSPHVAPASALARAARRRACRLRLRPARSRRTRRRSARLPSASCSRRSTRRSSSTDPRATRSFARCSTSPPRRSPPDRARPKLIVWPETSLPFLLTDRPDALVAIGDVLSDGQILLAGNVRAEGQGTDAQRYYNSVVAINDHGEIVDAVDKVHLVPGGEYLPFADFFRQHRPRPLRRHADAVFGGNRSPSDHGCRRAAGRDLHLLRGHLSRRGGARGGGRRLHRQRHQRCLVRRYAGALPAFSQRADPRRREPACRWSARPTTAFRQRSIRAAASSMRSRSTCAAALDVTIDIPTPTPPLLGDPRRNGYLVMALLALVGIGMNVLQKLRRI